METWIYIYKDLERKDRGRAFEFVRYGYVVCFGSLPPKLVPAYSWWMRPDYKTAAVGWYKLECSTVLDANAVRKLEASLNREHIEALVAFKSIASLGLDLVVSESYLLEVESPEPVGLAKPGLLSAGLKVSS